MVNVRSYIPGIHFTSHQMCTARPEQTDILIGVNLKEVKQSFLYFIVLADGFKGNNAEYDTFLLSSQVYFPVFSLLEKDVEIITEVYQVTASAIDNRNEIFQLSFVSHNMSDAISISIPMMRTEKSSGRK